MSKKECGCEQCTSRPAWLDRANSRRLLLRECNWCSLRLSVADFPDTAPTRRCSHGATVCTSCLRQYLADNLLLFGESQPFCPSDGCLQTLEADDVEEFHAIGTMEDTDDFEEELTGDATAELLDAAGSTGLDPLYPTAIRQCAICLEDLLASRYSKRPPTSSCTHSPLVCRNCLRRFIYGRVKSFGAADLPCPTPRCAQLLQYEDVRKFASGKMFERYDQLLLRKQLGEEPGFIWCKNPSCGSGQYHDDGDTSHIVICSQCRSKSCFLHDVPWHEGLTCQEYDKANAADKAEREAAVREYLGRKTKQCPKCHAPIEKIAGCDHMTCRPPGGCGYQFCWSCLADYQAIVLEGNHRHGLECRFYAAWTQASHAIPHIDTREVNYQTQ